jgi:hypothetical protein
MVNKYNNYCFHMELITTILNESTTFHNQIMRVLFIILYRTTCFGL